jgi:hypothetical protein
MDLFLGIDGSGPGDNTEYARDFSDSFVNRYFKSGPFFKRGYVRGPGMMGSEVRGLVNSGRAWVIQQTADMARHNQPYRLFLSGYSRGGACVTEIAYELKGLGIKVHAMLLFDSVDQSELSNVDTVPSNVKYCYHAMRDPKAGSREFFGNCSTSAAAGVVYQSEKFHCTHGAMGGTPWKTAGKSGKIEELSTGQKSGVVAGAGILLGPIGAVVAKSQADKQDFTNVTLDQENAAGPAIWRWMGVRLAIAQQDVNT